MKTIEMNAYGSSAVLEYNSNASKPEPGPKDILVRVKATSVNPVDILKRQGYGRPIFEKKRKTNFPWIMGNDGAGIVERTGAHVKKFKNGDEVFFSPNIGRSGTWAEYAAIAENEAAMKPKNLTFEEAGSIPYVAMTTWSALVGSAKLTPENAAVKKALVHAGSGGIGTFAIQLLKSWGCFVATTCSTKNVELVKSLGADVAIDYTQEDFSQVLKDYDLVYDTLGFKVPQNEEKSISILKKKDNANYVSIVHPALSILTEKGLLLGLPIVIAKLIGKKLKHKGVHYHWSIFKPNGEALMQVGQLIEAGKIKAVIDRTFDLSQMAEAHDYVEMGRARGKIVITI